MNRIDTEVLIIGAGAIGTALARELSRYKVDVIVVDGRNDVGGDASKSNSAIVHTGFDAEPGSLESELVVHANPMFDELCAKLDIPFLRCGAILVATTDEEERQLPLIMKKAEANMVPDVTYLTGEKILEMEGDVTSDVRGGLHIPRESIIDPFILVVAQAENAAQNGVAFQTPCEIRSLEFRNEFIAFHDRGEIRAKYLVNAAGLGADTISGYLGIEDYTMHPRRGQFHVLDRAANLNVKRIILPVPTKLTKGKLITPTIHGNWLIGPTAEELEDRSAYQTTREGMTDIIEGVRKLVPAVDPSTAITQYAGLRPVRAPGGYSIRAFPHLPGYLELSGIRSTGVSSSPAVARHCLRTLLEMGMTDELDDGYVQTRDGIPRFRDLDVNIKDRLIGENPLYGRIVCRCETITEAEIVEAIRRVPGAKDIDGIKRRVRAGLGRCQGGFCGTRIPGILARELEISQLEVTKKGAGSGVLTPRAARSEG